MVLIVQHLLSAGATTTLTTVATPMPGPNDHGWNNDDVAVERDAESGSCVVPHDRHKR